MAVNDIHAELRYCPVSAQKVRLVIDLIRGKSVDVALSNLSFVNKASAPMVRKLVASALANAEQNFGLNRENLYIHTVTADEAPTRKWRRFGARGRFKPILRRSSHINVILREKEVKQ